MRWKHPVHGDVSPDTFIPLAENSGMIGPLTRRAVTASLATLSDLRTEGHDLTVAVNLSPRLLTDLEVPHWLRDCLDADRIPPARLTVEVTESSISADPKRAMRVLAELRDLGVRIAIDDFGTGYSSLSYLTKLQPDDLKIDKWFVIRMRTDDDSAVIVRSTIELAHGLGLQVIAEGVEDQATYDALAGLGCDRVQGFHVARPMPADVLAGWASQPRRRTGPSWTTRQGSAHGEVVAAPSTRTGVARHDHPCCRSDRSRPSAPPGRADHPPRLGEAAPSRMDHVRARGADRHHRGPSRTTAAPGRGPHRHLRRGGVVRDRQPAHSRARRDRVGRRPERAGHHRERGDAARPAPTRCERPASMPRPGTSSTPVPFTTPAWGSSATSSRYLRRCPWPTSSASATS